MTWRVVRTELLRGTAPVAGATFAVAGAALLYNETESWAGRWAPLAQYIRVMLIVLIPLAVAAGAWQAGRERRRRIDELLGTTPRPPWRRVIVTWAAVTLGTWFGLLLVWLSGAVLVAPVATYPGRWWWPTLAVALVGLAAASAIGVALGRLVPSRLTAPVAAVATYAGIGILAYDNGRGRSWLSPAIGNRGDGTLWLPPAFQGIQALWLGAVGATFLVLVATRRKWLAVLPAAVALVAAWPIVGGAGYDRWENDPQARALVCTDSGPQVCMTRVNAFLLDDVAEPIQQGLRRWAGVPGGFVRAVDGQWRDERDDTRPPDGTAELYLDTLIAPTGGLMDRDQYGGTIQDAFVRAAQDVALRACDDPDGPSEAVWWATEVAYFWAGGDTTGVITEGEGPAPFEVLLRMDQADQKAWMGRYLAAARSCDEAAFAELMAELR